ncbi:putative 2OG-Fe(II) oxygenase family oxidoreductase [Astrocystis sublimbata]|nr:putative 2OG-Fe(II) oxygenase family oxidoreductase [Astrocystis sublimbata]
MRYEDRDVPVLDLKTIEFDKLVSNGPTEIHKLLEYCEKEGFFYLDLRGFDGRRTLVDKEKLLTLMSRFFNSSLQEKDEIGLPAQKHGYEPVGLHAGLSDNSRDGYECFKVALSELASDSPTLPRILKNEQDLKTLYDFSASGDMVTKIMLSSLSTAMGLKGNDRFETFHRSWGNSNYIGSFTLLFSDQYGLQIQPANQPNAEFGFVEPREGHAIINVGDSLRFASGRKLYSCIHRVVPFDNTRHRYSIAYFLRPEIDANWKDSEGRNVTAGQWHDEKYEVFSATHEAQRTTMPKTMLLGGMTEQIGNAAA